MTSLQVLQALTFLALTLMGFSQISWHVFFIGGVGVGALLLERLLANRRRKRERAQFLKDVAAAVSGERVELPAPVLPLEKSLDPADPRIYLDAQYLPKSQNWIVTWLQLRNGGGSDAHRVQIRPLEIAYKQIGFDPIEVMRTGEQVAPHRSDYETRDLTAYILDEWNFRGELTNDVTVPIKIEYSDFTGKKRFESSMLLVFHPIQFTAERSGNWAPSERPRIWEVRGLEFNRLA